MDFLRNLPSFLFAVVFSLSGQALLKKGIAEVLHDARPPVTIFLREYLPNICLSPFVVGGVALSGIGLVGYMYVLSKNDVGQALPIMGALAYVGMFFVGRFFLKEQSGWVNFVGILVILGGLYLVSLKSPAAAATDPHLSPKQVPTSRAD